MPTRESRRAKGFKVGISLFLILLLTVAGIVAGALLKQKVTPSGPKPGYAVGQPFPYSAAQSITLANRVQPLAQGTRATIVVLIASWCKYCAYDDAYVWPLMVRRSGVTVDIVDISRHGGIARPGPISPPFQGQDGSGPLLSTAGLIQVMKQYRNQFPLSDPHIHIYVKPGGFSGWYVGSYPTVAFVNRKGIITSMSSGGITMNQANTWLNQALAKGS